MGLGKMFGPEPQWWNAKKDEAHEMAFAAFDLLVKNDTQGQLNQRHARLYGHKMHWGVTAGSYDHINATRVLKLNIVQSMVDTITNMIGQAPVRTVFMTDGANFKRRRNAREMTKFIEGVQHQNKGRKQFQAVLRDAAVFGYGVVKNWTEDDKICFGRVFPDELRWDRNDALYGNPQVLWQYRTESRSKWFEKFPKKKTEVMDAPDPQNKDSFRHSKEAKEDRIEVLEGWRLPSYPGAKDGKHILCLRSGTLDFSEWKRDYHPFSWLHMTDPVQGLVGRGLAELLTGVQVAINQHLDMIEKAFNWVGVPRIYVDDMSELSVSQINNLVGNVVTYRHGAQPPMISTPSVVPPELLGYLSFLLDWAYRIAGVAELQATGKKPQGLESGRAIREAADQHSVRHALIQANYEDLHVQVAEKIYDDAKEMKARGKTPRVLRPRGRTAVEKIDFGAIDLDRDSCEIKAFPTSLLPRTPAGRRAEIQDWMANGWVDQEHGMALLDMPDLDSATELQTAGRDDIEDLISRFLFDAPLEKFPELEGAEREMAEADTLYVAPDSFQALALGARLMNFAYLRARIEGVPEARRELLARWITDAESLMAPPEASMMPPTTTTPPTPAPTAQAPIPPQA